MDLESESSVLESVEDNNGLIGEVEKIGDKLVSASVEVGKSIDLYDDDKSSNSPVRISPHPIAKGYGLRKWKRRMRREVVKDDDDTSLSMENSKILKRVLSGATDPHANKQMHVKQDSLGSVGSVNNYNFAIAGSSHRGVDSDNSEDRSSKSSTAASGPKVRYEKATGRSWDKQRAAKNFGGISFGDSSGQGKSSRVEKSKKLRGGERIKIEKENSHSSMESADSRSSNFVFMQGASFSLSNREQGGRRMMDYNEENSDADAHTSNRKDKVGEEEEEEIGDYTQGESVEESESKNNGSSDNLDPLTAAFNSFYTLQEALKEELQKFQELGKEEPISSLHNGAESSSCIQAGHKRASEATSSRRFRSEKIGEIGITSLDSEIVNLVNNVEHLENKLEETQSMLVVKDSQISQLESNVNLSGPRNRGTEIGVEDIFQQKMEAEIEYIIFSRSVDNLNRQIKLIEDEKTLADKTLSKLGEAETKAENLKNQAQHLQNDCVEITETREVKSFKKRVKKTTSCLLLQLGLLVLLFIQLMPEPENVVPT